MRALRAASPPRQIQRVRIVLHTCVKEPRAGVFFSSVNSDASVRRHLECAAPFLYRNRLVLCYGFAMYLARTRFLFFLASLACASIIGVAFYLQQAVGLDPCALCMVQRAAFIVCGVLALCAACHAPGPKGTRRYSLALLVVALAGLSTAGTQVWLQTASADQLIPVITRLEHVLSLLSWTCASTGCEATRYFAPKSPGHCSVSACRSGVCWVLRVWRCCRCIPFSANSATGWRPEIGAAIKRLYELYLLRTLMALSSGHNLGRTRHWKYAVLTHLSGLVPANHPDRHRTACP